MTVRSAVRLPCRTVGSFSLPLGSGLKQHDRNEFVRISGVGIKHRKNESSSHNTKKKHIKTSYVKSGCQDWVDRRGCKWGRAGKGLHVEDCGQGRRKGVQELGGERGPDIDSLLMGISDSGGTYIYFCENKIN